MGKITGRDGGKILGRVHMKASKTTLKKIYKAKGEKLEECTSASCTKMNKYLVKEINRLKGT